MNIPFPKVYPGVSLPKVTYDGRPYDEDTELTRLEDEHKDWLDSIGNQYEKHVPIGMQTLPPIPKPKVDDTEVRAPRIDEDVIVISDDSSDMEEVDLPELPELSDTETRPEIQEDEDLENAHRGIVGTPDSDAPTLVLIGNN